MAMYEGHQVPETKSRCTRGNRVSTAGIGGNWGRSRGAKEGDRFDGVRNGSRVASRIEDAFGISRVFDRLGGDRETSQRGKRGYFSLSFFNDLDKRNEKTRFKFNVYSWDLSWKSENWSSIFANERVISSCSGGGKVFKVDGREPSLTLKEARPRASLKIHRVVTLSILCKLSIPLHPVPDHKSTFDYVI